MHFSGYLLSKLGGWRKTFFITAEMTIISLWWGIIPKWFGRRHTVWDVDWMHASCIKMENVFPTTLTSVTIVPCNYRKKPTKQIAMHDFSPFFVRGNFIERLGTPYVSGLPCQGCKGHCGRLKRKINPITQKRMKNKYRRFRSSPLIVSKTGSNKKKVCTNACHVADLWSNCQALENQWPQWVCGWRNTTDGLERFRNCQATCICPNKIKN